MTKKLEEAEVSPFPSYSQYVYICTYIKDARTKAEKEVGDLKHQIEARQPLHMSIDTCALYVWCADEESRELFTTFSMQATQSSSQS